MLLSEMQTYLVTGAAGFIGHHLALALASGGARVIAVDNLDPSNDFELKKQRLARFSDVHGISFHQADVRDIALMSSLFSQTPFECVFHLAAQAGLRRHRDEPRRFFEDNVVGFQTVLDLCFQHQTKHLVLASSSSLYGQTHGEASRESDHVDSPLSVYAATKRSNELMAQAYAHQYGLAITAARLFTVYGPWGRGDMAPLQFARKISSREPIDLHEPDSTFRDFTYIDDVVRALVDLGQRTVPGFRAVNVGAGHPVSVRELVTTLESVIGRSCVARERSLDLSEVRVTKACNDRLRAVTGSVTQTPLREGLRHLVEWMNQ
jgi:UDP-glucuronate 4-epimerase